jgi:hypothetical protein
MNKEVQNSKKKAASDLKSGNENNQFPVEKTKEAENSSDKQLKNRRRTRSEITDTGEDGKEQFHNNSDKVREDIKAIKEAMKEAIEKERGLGPPYPIPSTGPHYQKPFSDKNLKQITSEFIIKDENIRNESNKLKDKKNEM